MSHGGLLLDDAAWASPWRTRCVRDKAVLSLGLLACALCLPPWPGGVLTAVVALAIVCGPAAAPPRTLVRSLGAPLAFTLIGAASVLVSVRWEGGMRLGLGSVETAGALLVRSVAGLLSVYVLATTTPMIDLLAALRRARVPEACVDVAALMYRFTFVAVESARAVRDAQLARLGYADRASSLRCAASLSAAILTRTMTHAERLEAGLAGRGYDGALPTLPTPLRASTRFVLVSVLLVAGLVAVSLGYRWMLG